MELEPCRHSSRRTGSTFSRSGKDDSRDRRYRYYTQSGGRILEVRARPSSRTSRPPTNSWFSERDPPRNKAYVHVRRDRSPQDIRHASKNDSGDSSEARDGQVVYHHSIEKPSDESGNSKSSRRGSTRSSRRASKAPSSAKRDSRTIIETITEKPDQQSDSDQTIHPLKFRSDTAPSTTTSRQSSIFSSWFRGNSAAPARPRKKKTVRLVECLICASDDVPSTESAKLACGHRMCHSCLRQLFVMSTTDPAHMPPKCCTSHHIPLEHVETIFDNRFKSLWNRKYREFTTQDRLYCPSKKCGEWIRPSSIHTDPRHPDRKYGVCRRCKTKVCGTCNNKYHKRSECPDDPETAHFIASAKEQGWQRCYSCKAMVELREGCNHMTCRCTAEFCIVCGSPWKTCECPWFSYEAVLEHDRLNHMRVPVEPPVRRPRTYGEELESRMRQEMDDEAVARQLELELILEALNPGFPVRPQHRRFDPQHAHRIIREVVHEVREPSPARPAARQIPIQRHNAAAPILPEPAVEVHVVQRAPVEPPAHIPAVRPAPARAHIPAPAVQPTPRELHNAPPIQADAQSMPFPLPVRGSGTHPPLVGEQYIDMAPLSRSPSSDRLNHTLTAAEETLVSNQALNEAGIAATVTTGRRRASGSFVRIAQNGGKAVGGRSARIMGWLDRVDPREGEGPNPWDQKA